MLQGSNLFFVIVNNISYNKIEVEIIFLKKIIIILKKRRIFNKEYSIIYNNKKHSIVICM